MKQRKVCEHTRSNELKKIKNGVFEYIENFNARGERWGWVGWGGGWG